MVVTQQLLSKEILALQIVGNFLAEFETISGNLPEIAVKTLTNNVSKKVRSPSVSRIKSVLLRRCVSPESLLNWLRTAAYYKPFPSAIISKSRPPTPPSPNTKQDY